MRLVRQLSIVRIGLIALVLTASTAFSQTRISVELNWQGVQSEQLADQLTLDYLSFDRMDIGEDGELLYVNSADYAGSSAISATVEGVEFTPLSGPEARIAQNAEVKSDIQIDAWVKSSRGQQKLVYSFNPIVKDESGWKRVSAIELRFDPIAHKQLKTVARSFAANSVLSAGSWYKIGLTQQGMYKVTYEMLKSMGATSVELSSSTIGLFGNGGKMLPFNNDEFRTDDLGENTIKVVDGDDGVFGPGDYFLFYASGPHHWEYLESGSSFEHVTHQYSDTAYYFITTDRGTGLRVADRSSLNNADTTLATFYHYDFYENDLTSLNKSGRTWYGETFNTVVSYDIPFVIPDVDQSEDVQLKFEVAARTIGKDLTSYFDVSKSGQTVGQIAVPGVTGDYAGKYAEDEAEIMTFTPTGSSNTLTIDFVKASTSALGWLDFIELSARRNLSFQGNVMNFRNAVFDNMDTLEYRITNMNSGTVIWDVTDPFDVKNQLFNLNGSQATFAFDQQDAVHEFVAFNAKEFKTPKLVGAVQNQNLHGMQSADYVVITNKLFRDQAEELAAYHEENDGLSTLVVTDEQIFNEFSSGARDITAMKDFLKMFYDRAAGVEEDMVDYLLLFGDGSYDNKYRVTGNSNYILTYQSSNSLHAIGSYISDDYFGLLDDDEGERTSDLIDLGIGRLPVSSVGQAKQAVNKIKHYGTTKTFGSWRNVVGFIGDDEDSKIHMIQTDLLAEYLDTAVLNVNLDKIYFDAYQQETSAGGDRYPGVTEAIDNRVTNGSLLISYIGHGGELGWGHERVLEVGQINGYENLNNLPLFMTATCEFARYDDPERTSAGEFVFLNPNGGGIGLLTTTRLVLSSPNFALATEFNNIAFERLEDGTMPRLGDLLHMTKLGSPLTINTRNFTLLGDPAVRLAYPEHQVLTTALPDTLQALGRVTVRGIVADQQGNKLEGYNGVVYPTVFDKETTVNTLNNDGMGKFGFGLQRSVIYNGKASVTNGEFEFSFVVPRDISHATGFGKISYYTEDGVEDGAGSFEDFYITGTDTTAAADEVGPDIELFMNDEQFIYGGITDENPLLYVKLFDENGINTVGTGIGHDIMMTIDGNTAESRVLNDFYESELDSYQKGTVNFRLSDLEEGKHTITLKAWDVFNNSNESEIEFYVVKESDLTLDHVLNYPNPFTTNTAFYFEHNQPHQNLDIRIQVFTVSGKVVRTIDTSINTDGFRAGPVAWDGKDDFGDPIGRGTYMYKMKVTSPTGQSVEKFEKLVIL